MVTIKLIVYGEFYSLKGTARVEQELFVSTPRPLC